MRFPRSAGFSSSACTVDELPALFGYRTRCLATCVISRLRRASVFGLRRVRNSNFDRILHRLPDHRVASRLRCPPLSSLRFQRIFNFDRLLHRLPYW